MAKYGKDTFLVENQKPEFYKQAFTALNGLIKSRFGKEDPLYETIQKLYHLGEFVISIVDQLDFEKLLEFENLYKMVGDYHNKYKLSNEEKKTEAQIITNIVNDNIFFYQKMYHYNEEETKKQILLNEKRRKLNNASKKLEEIEKNVNELCNEKSQASKYDIMSQHFFKSYRILQNCIEMLKKIHQFINYKMDTLDEVTPEIVTQIDEVIDDINAINAEIVNATQIDNFFSAHDAAYLLNEKLIAYINEIEEQPKKVL